MCMNTFHIHALPTELLLRVRATGTDEAGGAAEHVTAEGGEPLRCCLRNAEPGASLLLFNYVPPLPPSPYRESGAVYIHADACLGAGDAATYPPDWYGRPQVLRAYDSRGWIHPATTTHDGSDPERAIEDVLGQPGVAFVHSRNVAYGCYMFAVTKS
jgi:Protein of unknown function (DUF1203)